MSLFAKERRKRIRLPFSVLFFSCLLIVSPVLQILFFKIHRNESVSAVLHSLKLYQAVFMAVPLICGIGLFLLKKWSWYLFLVYSIVLLLYNSFLTVRNPDSFNFISIAETALLFSAMVFFLRKDISAPYMKMYPRGFRGEKRRPVVRTVLINGMERKTRDISETGLYADWTEAPFQLNEEVSVLFPDDPVSSPARKAGVVRIDENGVGFAFRE